MSVFSQFVGGGRIRSQNFLSSGNFTVPAGVTTVWVTMCGGGGSGAARGSDGAGGGGAGGYTIKRAVNVTPGATITVTIGAGGAGVIPGNSGNNGNATSFGSESVAGGGRGRDLFSILFFGGVGGAIGASGGNASYQGPNPTIAQGLGGVGGESAGGLFNWGGGAGGLFGDGTAASTNSTTSSAAANSGAGSGGAANGSGNGGSGRCIVEWFA